MGEKGMNRPRLHDMIYASKSKKDKEKNRTCLYSKVEEEGELPSEANLDYFLQNVLPLGIPNDDNHKHFVVTHGKLLKQMLEKKLKVLENVEKYADFVQVDKTTFTRQTKT